MENIYKKIDKIPEINLRDSFMYKEHQKEKKNDSLNINTSQYLPIIEGNNFNSTRTKIFNEFSNTNNNKREINIGNSNINNIKDKTLNKLDQQIISNFKSTIESLYIERDKLQLEYQQLERNYNALLIKQEEDSFKIKNLKSKAETQNLSPQLDQNNKAEKDLLIKEIDSLKIKNSHIESQLQEYLNNKTILESEKTKLNKAQEKINALTIKEQSLNSIITKLDEKNTGLHDEIKLKFEQIKEFKAQLKLLKQDILQKEEQIKTLILEKNSFIEKIKEMEIQQNNSFEEIKLLKHTISDKITQNNDLIKEINQWRVKETRENNKKEHDNNFQLKLEEQIKELNNHIEKKSTEIEIFENLIDKERKRNSELNQMIYDKQETINNCKRSNLELSNEIFQLNKDLENLRIEKDKINQEFTSFQASEIEYLSENLKKITELNEKKDMEIELLVKRIGSLNDENDDLVRKANVKRFICLEMVSAKSNGNIFGNMSFSIINKIDKGKFDVLLKNLISFQTLQFKRVEISLEKYKNKFKSFEISFDKIKSNYKSIDLNQIDLLNFKYNNQIKLNITMQREQAELNEKLKGSEEKNKSLVIEVNNFKEKYEKLFMDNQQINSLLEKLKTKENEYINMKNQFKFANDIFSKLKLTVETIYLAVSCKYCYENKEDFIMLSCGHSICKSCAASSLFKSCFDCKLILNVALIEGNKAVKNEDFIELSKRIIYLNQVKSDIDKLLEVTK